MIKQFLKGRFVPEKMVLRILISVMLLTFAKYSMGKPITYIWDLTELKALRNLPTSEAYKQVVSLANMRMKSGVVAVTDKQTSISGNKHEYESLSIYWWPDPKNLGGPYIAKDGEYNPEYKQYDFPRLLQLVENLRDCSKAFYLTGDLKYYGFFCHQLDTWFINEATRMQPDFNYCQFIPGRNGNRGNPQGMIDAYNFNDVLESIRLVHSKKSIGRKRMKALKNWFGSFAEWMQTSSYGQTAANFKNSQAVAYDVTLYDMYLFAGNQTARRQIRQSFYEKRVATQIEPDGRLPQELLRTKAFYYSISCIRHFVDFLTITIADGAMLDSLTLMKISSSIDFLTPYVGHQELFPYSEIGDWKGHEALFKTTVERFKQLPNR